ncbi:hypothetical protein ROSINTL182_06189 [Roseburia intestinalis L1-82]|uniref:Uncharacterized protein n=1 Tax=Roseburia intestinalis L1-82 TaxID=536231 RepID=C7G8G5_9FIRM|nr:hypothetical protein ROSINTL182_06189 [Roseburia intestinalis L1-82]
MENFFNYLWGCVFQKMCSDYRLKNDKKNETWGQVPFLGEGIFTMGYSKNYI